MSAIAVPAAGGSSLIEGLRRRAEELRDTATQLEREARRLEYEASAGSVQHVTVNPHAARSRRCKGKAITARELDTVMDMLATLQPTTSSVLAEHLNISVSQAQARLLRLEALGTARREGLKRGTRWFVRSDDDDSVRLAHRQDHRVLIRDKGRELGVFTVREMCEALPDITEVTIRRWLRHYEDEGMFYAERVGTAKLYEFQKAEGPHVPRPKHTPIEREAVRTFSIPRLRGGVAIAGTGGGRVSGSKIVDELAREVRAYGVTTRKTKHRIDFIKDGKVIANSSSTPGASHLGQTRRQLIEAGVPVSR